MKLQKPVVVIVGPTASGKTQLSINLASRFHGEIISADSRQIYRGMDIGTAKPTSVEMMDIPHHLINIADPSHPWSLAEFQKDARKAINEIRKRNLVPFIVGGTGQFIWGLVEGWKVPDQPINSELRLVLENWSNQIGKYGIHQALRILDPKAADLIQPENARRTIRALEVIFSSGMRFSDQRLKQPTDEDFIMVGIQWDRKHLYERVDERIENMMNSGLVDEVRDLIDSELDVKSSAISAIGYCEIVDYLIGKTSLEEAVILIKRHTRQYIRRQANWFKLTDPRIKWFDSGPDLSVKVSDYLARLFE